MGTKDTEPVHLLKSAKAKEWEAKCGFTVVTAKGMKDGMPDSLTVWGSKVTCPACGPSH